MEGAARLLVEGLEGASEASRASFKSAVEAVAKTATEEEANALSHIKSTISDTAKSEQVATAMRALMINATDKETMLLLNKLDSSTLKIIPELTTEEIESLTKISSNVITKFPDLLANSLINVSRLEQIELLKFFQSPVTRALLSDASYLKLAAQGEAVITSEVTRLLETAAVSEPKFTKVMKAIYATAKVAVVGGAVAYCATWIASYMTSKSGPFFTVKAANDPLTSPTFKGAMIDAKKRLEKKIVRKRIFDPYPCGFYDKSGDIRHPLDSYIKVYAPSPCADWRKYDACGGWTNVSHNGRIHAAFTPSMFIEALKILDGGILSCDDVSFPDAMVALVHEAGYTVGSILRETTQGVVEGLGVNFATLQRIVCIVTSMFLGYITYTKTLNKIKYPFFLALLVALTSLTLLLIVFPLRKIQHG